MFELRSIRMHETNMFLDWLRDSPDPDDVLDYIRDKKISLGSKLSSIYKNPGQVLSEKGLLIGLPNPRSANSWLISSLLYYTGILRITPGYQEKLEIPDYHALGCSHSKWKQVENIKERVKKPWKSRRVTAFVEGAVQAVNVEAILWAAAEGLKVHHLPPISNRLAIYACHLLRLVDLTELTADMILRAAAEMKNAELDAEIVQFLRDKGDDPFRYQHIIALSRSPMANAWHRLLIRDWDRKKGYTGPIFIHAEHERHTRIMADPLYREVILSALDGLPLEKVVRILHSAIHQEGMETTLLGKQLTKIANADEEARPLGINTGAEALIQKAIQELFWS